MRNPWWFAPWFVRGSGISEEPFSYRAWKWLWQRVYRGQWASDLFDRIEANDWDVLVVLDACRYDVLSDVAENAVIGKAVSPASATPQFLQRARERGLFDGTVYVSGNPQTGEYPLGDDVEHVPLYETDWNDELTTVLPSDIYDRVEEHLESGRRVVAHTVQPHYPHVCEVDGFTLPVPNGLHPDWLGIEDDEIKLLQTVMANGLVDLAEARRSYEVSVRYAWENASRFAGRMAGDGYTVTVTADHGELFGERGFVEHPVGIGMKRLTEVPWVTFRPPRRPTVGDSVEEKLSALGYAE